MSDQLASVRFLVGVLADLYERKAKSAAKRESNWRSSLDEWEEAHPEPAARDGEEWQELVELTGEVYYAMAKASHSRSTHLHLERLLKALDD